MRRLALILGLIFITFAATGQEPVPNPYSPAKTAGVRMPDNTKVCSPGTEPTTGKVLKFDGTCWDSGTDNTGGGGGSLTVEEADGNPSVSNVEALQFNQASGFSVVDEEAGQVQVNFTITDSLVPNDITASNYCALGGCTFVGNVIFGNLGFTGTASDTNPTCEAGDYRIYADDSETKWKKCQDGVLSDLDTDTDTDTDALVDLTGVSISDPSDGQILQYGSGVWGNVTPPFQPTGTYSGIGSCDPNEVVTGLNDGAAPTCSALGDSDIPNDITIDNATTADSLAENGTNCSAGQAARGVDASGNAEDCFTPGGGGGSVTVRESDGTPSVSDASTISFNQSQGFTVTDQGAGEAEVGLALDAAQITYADNDDVYPTDNVGAAIEALRASNGIGPNQTTGKVNWQQVMNMPEDFADGVDDGATVLGGLSDVTETTPQDDDVLVRDTGAWVNKSSAPRADALAANPDNCLTPGQKAVGITADGTAECSAIAGMDVTFSSGDISASTVSGAIQELFDELNTPCGDGPNSATCSFVDFSVLDNVPAFAVPSGTNPTIDSAGDAAIDTTAGQFVYYGGTAAVVLTGQQSRCAVIESVTAADDNMMLGSFNVPVTINSVWCQYNGSAPSTVATFTLEDGAGNAMTITGTNPTCTAPGTNPTPAAVTAGNTLTAYELLRFDTTNTPDPATDTYLICIGFVYDRQ